MWRLVTKPHRPPWPAERADRWRRELCNLLWIRCGKCFFEPLLFFKVIGLPRQARDKRRGKVESKGVSVGSTVREILQHPRPRVANGPKTPEAATGPLAGVYHSGGWARTWPANAPSRIAGANENAGNSSRGALCASDWFGDGGWDVITLNFGLEDCARPSGVSATAYASNLETIYQAAHAALNPGGSILWVSTLPAGANGTAVDKRCVRSYNAAAAKLFATKNDTVIADLYAAVTKTCGEDAASCPLQKASGAQLTASGRQFSGIVVAHAIAPLLGPAWAARPHELEGY